VRLVPTFLLSAPVSAFVTSRDFRIKNVRSGEFSTYDGVPYQPQRIACPTYVFYGTRSTSVVFWCHHTLTLDRSSHHTPGTQDYLSDPQDVATLTAALRASGNYLGSTSLEGYAHMGS
jgi:hypothetical protein